MLREGRSILTAWITHAEAENTVSCRRGQPTAEKPATPRSSVETQPGRSAPAPIAAGWTHFLDLVNVTKQVDRPASRVGSKLDNNDFRKEMNIMAAKILVFKCTDVTGLQQTIKGAHTITYGAHATSIPVTGLPKTMRGEVDGIVFYGSHGNFANGAPTQLNGVTEGVTRALVSDLVKMGVKTHTIVLDCCFSAGFIPLFRQLLVTGRTKPGTIVCHYGSASGTMAGLVDTSKSLPLRTATLGKFESLQDLGFDFVSLGIYVDGKSAKNYTVQRVSDLDSASRDYIDAIAGGASEADDVRGLKSFLGTSGVNVVEESSKIVSSVMTNAMIG